MILQTISAQRSALSILIKAGEKEDAKATYSNLVSIVLNSKNDVFYKENEENEEKIMLALKMSKDHVESI